MSTTRFAQNLARLRKHMGHSQQTMANILGTKTSTYASWEYGTAQPNIQMLELIQDRFRAPMDLMLGEDLHTLRGDQYAAFRLTGVRNISQTVK
jgi:transcriptional regulator with XRE-family HTH domain